MKNILIVDDDIYIGNALEETLLQNGYQVSRAYSGTEAVFAVSHNLPDLILLDLMLPGMDGEDVLKHISNIPVIVRIVKFNKKRRHKAVKTPDETISAETKDGD